MTRKRAEFYSTVKVYLLTLLFFAGGKAATQTRYDAWLDSLKWIQEMPYICEAGEGCGDTLFWRVTSGGLNIIPELIDRLDDTTATGANVVLFGGMWTVADVVYAAMQEIIHDIPTFALQGARFDRKGCGYCAYWKHVNAPLKNRRRFQKKVKKWYASNRRALIWVPGNDFVICDCNGMQHPNGGHYELPRRGSETPGPANNK